MQFFSLFFQLWNSGWLSVDSYVYRLSSAETIHNAFVSCMHIDEFHIAFTGHIKKANYTLAHIYRSSSLGTIWTVEIHTGQMWHLKLKRSFKDLGEERNRLLENYGRMVEEQERLNNPYPCQNTVCERWSKSDSI